MLTTEMLENNSDSNLKRDPDEDTYDENSVWTSDDDDSSKSSTYINIESENYCTDESNHILSLKQKKLSETKLVPNYSEDPGKNLQYRTHKQILMLRDLTVKHLPPKCCTFFEFENRTQSYLEHLIALSKDTSLAASKRVKPSMPPASGIESDGSSCAAGYDTRIIHDCLLSCINWETLLECEVQQNAERARHLQSKNFGKHQTSQKQNGDESITAIDIVLNKVAEIVKHHFFLTEIIFLFFFQISSLVFVFKKRAVSKAMPAFAEKSRRILLTLVSSSTPQFILSQTICSLILKCAEDNINLQHNKIVFQNNWRNIFLKHNINEQTALINNAIWFSMHLIQQSENNCQNNNRIANVSIRNQLRHMGTSLGIQLVQTLTSILSFTKSSFSKIETIKTSENRDDLKILQYMMELLRDLTMRCARESKFGIAFQHLLQSSRQHPKRVLLRVAAIIACLHIRGYHLQMKCNSIHYLLKQLWMTEYQSFINTFGMEYKREDVLRMYVEIVVECPIFDNTKDCWMALRPLVDFCQNGKDAIVLRAIGAILIQRGESVLSSDKDQFHWMVKVLKENFGDPKFASMWGYDYHVKGTKSLKKILMKFGILSDDAQKLLPPETATTVYTQNENIEEIWPFPPPLSMRMVFHKTAFSNSSLIKSILRDRQLSKVEQSFLERPSSSLKAKHVYKEMEKETHKSLSRILVPKVLLKQKKKDKIKRGSGNVPVMPRKQRRMIIMQTRELKKKREKDILCKADSQAKLIGHIFSFLNYKRLCRAMQVCKLWNIIGRNRQDIWKTYYFKRFPNAIFPVYMTHQELNLLNKKWDFWFRQKVVVERKVRKSIIKAGNKSGWIIQCCQYIGCTRIIYEEKNFVAHMNYHNDEVFKNRKNNQFDGTVGFNEKGSKAPVDGINLGRYLNHTENQGKSKFGRSNRESSQDHEEKRKNIKTHSDSICDDKNKHDNVKRRRLSNPLKSLRTNDISQLQWDGSSSVRTMFLSSPKVPKKLIGSSQARQCYDVEKNGRYEIKDKQNHTDILRNTKKKDISSTVKAPAAEIADKKCKSKSSSEVDFRYNAFDSVNNCVTKEIQNMPPTCTKLSNSNSGLMGIIEEISKHRSKMFSDNSLSFYLHKPKQRTAETSNKRGIKES